MTRLVVFFNNSGISHSCRPNAIFDWQDNFGMVRAITTIDIGEEIVLDRLPVPDELKWATTNHRQDYIRDKYDYKCRCHDCQPDTREEGDSVRQRLGFLREHLIQFRDAGLPTNPSRSILEISSGLAFANEYISLLLQIGGRDMRLVEAHLYLAGILELLEDRNGAQDHAVRAMVIGARAYGS